MTVKGYNMKELTLQNGDFLNNLLLVLLATSSTAFENCRSVIKYYKLYYFRRTVTPSSR